jgi:hypothetical protein
MIIHHPDRGTFHSIKTLITTQVGQFWKAHPGQFSKAPKIAKVHSYPDTLGYANDVALIIAAWRPALAAQ